jgi:hypothetical protein
MYNTSNINNCVCNNLFVWDNAIQKCVPQLLTTLNSVSYVINNNNVDSSFNSFHTADYSDVS